MGRQAVNEIAAQCFQLTLARGVTAQTMRIAVMVVLQSYQQSSVEIDVTMNTANAVDMNWPKGSSP